MSVKPSTLFPGVISSLHATSILDWLWGRRKEQVNLNKCASWFRMNIFFLFHKLIFNNFFEILYIALVIQNGPVIDEHVNIFIKYSHLVPLYLAIILAYYVPILKDKSSQHMRITHVNNLTCSPKYLPFSWLLQFWQFDRVNFPP